MKPTDDLGARLRGAIDSLPVAPDDPAFRRRVLQVAALTPQEVPAGAAVSRWSMVGFGALGLTIGPALVILLLVAGRLVSPTRTAPAVSALLYDPVELIMASHSGSGHD